MKTKKNKTKQKMSRSKPGEKEIGHSLHPLCKSWERAKEMKKGHEWQWLEIDLKGKNWQNLLIDNGNEREEGSRMTPKCHVCANRWEHPLSCLERGLLLSRAAVWHHIDCSQVIQLDTFYSWGESVCLTAWNPLPEMSPRMLAHRPRPLPLLFVGPSSLLCPCK